MTAAARLTGRYVRQPSGYAAFLPEPLPPQPDIRMDAEMQTLLSRADRALGRLDGSIQSLPNPDLFVLMYVRKEAVLSSQIEGTQSSITDVLEAEARIFNPRRPSDVGEVLNYVAAMNHGLRRLEALPLSIGLIREIHERLMHDVRGRDRMPGELRRTQNWIGPAGCTINEASYVPPPPNDMVNALSDLERFLHAETDLPALIKIGLAHAQFETIHPFLDGNGRLGRLLITFLLCQSGILIKPVLYLSHYLRQNRPRHYELLQATRDDGDWESWLKFFVHGVATVSGEATETARRVVERREQDRNRIVAELGRAAGSGLTLLERLFANPITGVNTVAEWTGLSYPAANRLVGDLVDLGILVEVTGRTRNRVFRYEPYIDLFAEG